MRWLVPGHDNCRAGKNLDKFLKFMARVGGHSFHIDAVAIMIGDNVSADATQQCGNRTSDPQRKLDINVIHFLGWRDGEVIKGQGAIFRRWHCTLRCFVGLIYVPSPILINPQTI
jgi:hypothetical protein